MARERLSSKVALVSGGASGIGAAIGRALGRRGAEVVLADRQLELANEVAASICQAGGAARAVELDVRSLDDFRSVARDIVERSGRIDYLFNNAGIGVGGEMDGYAPRDWDDVIDVNLRGVAHGIQAVYPRMIEQRSGHIVNTASIAGLVCTAGEGSYTATKHAVVGLSKALRIEARRHGVRVSALCPGVIRTPILTGGKYSRMNYTGLSDEALLAQWERLRPMEPDVFAEQVLDAVAKDEPIIIVPRWWKAIWYLERLSPRASFALWSAVLARLRRELEASGAQPLRSAAPDPVAAAKTLH